MLIATLAATMLLGQSQPQTQTSCGWEFGRWVCRDTTPVQANPQAAQQGMAQGYETARRVDEARRAREAARAQPATPHVERTVPVSDLPTTRATPTDVYVSCYGLARNNGGETCSLAGFIAVRDREGVVEGEDMRFCLPSSAEIDANPSLAMAYAYVDFYDRTAPQNLTDDGFLAFIAAMIDKWPCA